VVHLEALLQAAQDRDGVLDRGLIHQHRLEAPLERGVLLDVLAVLVERGGADAVQLAAREQRLEHVAGVHRALGLAGADDGVQLVDEQDDAAFGLLHLLQHRLEALLELAAVLGAGDQRAHVEREDGLVAQRLGHVAAHHACASPSTIAVLPTPGSPIRTGLFLVRRERMRITRRISSSRPITGSSLPRRASSTRIAAVALQRLVGLLGVVGGHALLAAHRGERLEEPVRGDAGAMEDGGRALAASAQHRQHEVLDADELVLQPLRLVLGLDQELVEPLGDHHRAGRGPGPETRGRRSSSLAISLRIPRGSTSRRFSRRGSRPSVWSSIASTRCSTSTCCCPIRTAID
jgi:hypothetical protein